MNEEKYAEKYQLTAENKLAEAIVSTE